VGSRPREEAAEEEMLARLAAAIVRSKKLAEKAEALCVAVGDEVEAAWELSRRTGCRQGHRHGDGQVRARPDRQEVSRP
jgi:hypothetical protein